MCRSAGEILADPYLKGTWVHSDSTHSMDMYLLSFSQSPRTRLSQGIAAQVHVLQRPFRECVEKEPNLLTSHYQTYWRNIFIE